MTKKNNVIKLTTGWKPALIEHIFEAENGLEFIFSVYMDKHYVQFKKYFSLLDGEKDELVEIVNQFGGANEEGFVECEQLLFEHVAVNMVKDENGYLEIEEVRKAKLRVS